MLFLKKRNQVKFNADPFSLFLETIKSCESTDKCSSFKNPYKYIDTRIYVCVCVLIQACHLGSCYWQWPKWNASGGRLTPGFNPNHRTAEEELSEIMFVSIAGTCSLDMTPYLCLTTN